MGQKIYLDFTELKDKSDDLGHQLLESPTISASKAFPNKEICSLRWCTIIPGKYALHYALNGVIISILGDDEEKNDFMVFSNAGIGKTRK